MDAYTRSNAILEVEHGKFSTPTYAALLADDGDREQRSQDLLDYLCDEFRIPHVRVIVADKPRKVSMGGRKTTHGFIKVAGYGDRNVSKYINVYNYTAKTHKVVAIKTFTGTLLHEFMHHYDLQFLRLDKSLHTAGFYTRISDLQKKLA